MRGHSSTTLERWRPIPWNPIYQVSDLGRVRNPYGRILKSCPAGKEGHPAVVLCRYGADGVREKVGRSVAVLVLRAFIGEAPKGCVAHHADLDITNNELRNLFWKPRSFVCRKHHARRADSAAAPATV